MRLIIHEHRDDQRIYIFGITVIALKNQAGVFESFRAISRYCCNSFLASAKINVLDMIWRNAILDWHNLSVVPYY